MRRVVSFALALCLTAGVGFAAFAQSTYQQLTSFNSFEGGQFPNGLTGHAPPSSPSDWALYGATTYGGATAADGSGRGFGIIYKLTPPTPPAVGWFKTRVYVFKGGADGRYPLGPLVFDKAGNAYGVTRGEAGGDAGTVFKLSPPVPPQYFWPLTTVARFTGLSGAVPGAQPSVGVTIDAAGALYVTSGATVEGVTNGGGVTKLTPPASGHGAWTPTVIYQAPITQAPAAAFLPRSRLTLGPAGELYGANSYGLMRHTPPASGTGSWTTTILRAPMTGNPDLVNGAMPRDATGALYGYRQLDGSGGYGAVMRYQAPAPGQTGWSATTLHSFDGFDGAYPYGELLRDDAGALYGATCCNGSVPSQGLGVVFKLTPPAAGQTAWGYQVLFRVTGAMGPRRPTAGLFRDGSGTLFGASEIGGYANQGTVFELSAP